MVDVIVIGTVAMDDIETPFGKVTGALGGSASYAAYSSSFFTKTGIVAVTGEDFPREHLEILKKRGIDMTGLKKEGKTFRWGGKYKFDMNEAETLKTELNCLDHFNPIIPKQYKNANYVLLGNIDPELQLKVLDQLDNASLVVTDTMNFWIESKKDKLLEVIKRSDVFVMNDGEARQLFETVNLVQAAKKALKLGPRAVIIKKGEHGAMMFTPDSMFMTVGYPLENIKDPTGCGDVFGGAFIGYLAKTADLGEMNMRKAVVYGSAAASYNAEDFSLNRMKDISLDEIEKRFHEFRQIKEF